MICFIWMRLLIYFFLNMLFFMNAIFHSLSEFNSVLLMRREKNSWNSEIEVASLAGLNENSCLFLYLPNHGKGDNIYFLRPYRTYLAPTLHTPSSYSTSFQAKTMQTKAIQLPRRKQENGTEKHRHYIRAPGHQKAQGREPWLWHLDYLPGILFINPEYHKGAKPLVPPGGKAR